MIRTHGLLSVAVDEPFSAVIISYDECRSNHESGTSLNWLEDSPSYRAKIES
jgi:hypothetical protein